MAEDEAQRYLNEKKTTWLATEYLVYPYLNGIYQTVPCLK